MPPTLFRFLVMLYIYGHVAGDDFRPTAIPLDEWRPDESRGRAGTLHETIQTASPSTTVVIPGHYWEDALRHSVYLTLVRDKIDQLIAKGEVIAPNSSPNLHNSNEVDDQDLWEKIKAAPFERLKEDEPTTYGDVTILARGRLLEEYDGFRFAEDEKSKEKCDNEKCMDGVKAFWSVKRVRQRDHEISPGRYHYELTFSVMSQIPPKQKKPYEHPIRTFTVQENDKGLEPTKAYHKPVFPTQGSRPERAIWFHKNIQVPQHRKRPQSGLDRLFSSWFDDDDEPSYDLPRRHKQMYHPSLSQYSKLGYVGGGSSEHYSHKAIPYPYRPHFGKYQSHPLTTPPFGLIPHNFETDFGGINNPYVSQIDYKASGLNNIQRTTRPAVLPTPLPPLPSPLREPYAKNTNTVKNDMSDNMTTLPDISSGHKQYNKAKANVKMSPFPEQLRPPIYDAPPGVFVTLDKKPFKPMPPLKTAIAKPLRTNKPIDFRPSPQVLDVQFSEPDPLFDTDFRPITVKSFDDSYTTEKISTAEDNEKGEESIRKPTVTVKRPPKEQNNAIKPHRITTTVPDIITANNSPEQDDDMEWADVFGIFTKTTPMETQKPKIPQTTTPFPTSSNTIKTTSKRTTTETPSTAVPSTVKPRKRTRPPPKFNKAEKIKKHKRITTTTTSTTTAEAPLTTKIDEEKNRKKLKQELTQQASNSVTATTKPKWEPSSKTSTTTPFSTIETTTTAYPTTTAKVTTTTKAITDEPVSANVRRNRFRQSTLMIKGTSVKHDKWTVTSPVPGKTKGQSIASSFLHRRKGSNFNGYVSTTPKTLDEGRNIHVHIDGTTTEGTSSPKMEDTTLRKIELTSTAAPTSYETNETSMDVEEEFVTEGKSQENYEETRDHSEYIFPKSSDINNSKNNEISNVETTLTTENIITTTMRPLVKKKKCKKKHQNLAPKTESNNVHEIKDISTTIAPSTTPLTTPSLLEDLLNDFSFEDSKSESQATTIKQDLDEEQSQPHEHYSEVNEDLEKLLDSLKNDKNEELSEEYDDEDENDDNNDYDDEKEHLYEEEDTSFQSTNDSPNYSQKDYEDNENRPYTLLELMAME